jgi:hypothetical protein
MPNTLLAELLDNRFSPLDVMAEAWLASGAKAVSLWNNNGLVASWPAGTQNFNPT